MKELADGSSVHNYWSLHTGGSGFDKIANNFDRFEVRLKREISA